jgi:pimeloyl-ACP methyl ester carboxylesterase
MKPGPIRTVHISADPKYVVILVHGTWAREADWTNQDSILVQELISKMGSKNVAIFARDWSGRNSAKQRAIGAIALQKDLTKLAAQYPQAEINVVAHSHGGNLAAKALDGHDNRRIGLACLSTPFLRARHRRAGGWTAKIVLANFSILAVTSVGGIYAYLTAYTHFEQTHWKIPNLLVGMVAISVYHFFKWFSKWLPNFLRKTGSRFSSSINFNLDSSTRLLIIKMADDEPGLALTTYRFLDWILDVCIAFVRRISIVWKMTFRMNRGRRTAFYRFTGPRFRGLSRLRVIFATLVFLFFLYLMIFGNQVQFERWFGPCAAILLLVFYLIISATGCIVCLIAVFSVLPLGWSAVFGSCTRTVSVDSTPRGSWNVSLFEPSLSGLGLRHSQPYADRRCLELLSCWLLDAPRGFKLSLGN